MAVYGTITGRRSGPSGMGNIGAGSVALANRRKRATTPKSKSVTPKKADASKGAMNDSAITKIVNKVVSEMKSRARRSRKKKAISRTGIKPLPNVLTGKKGGRG